MTFRHEWVGKLCYFKVLDSERASKSMCILMEGPVTESFGGGKEVGIRAM